MERWSNFSLHDKAYGVKEGWQPNRLTQSGMSVCVCGGTTNRTIVYDCVRVVGYLESNDYTMPRGREAK